MSIVLNPGFSGTITVRDEGSLIYSTSTVSELVLKDFIKRSDVAPPTESIFKSCFIPINHPDGAQFLKNLILPTFFNHALRVQNIVLKAIASVAALLLDAGTLIPRLICAPFKMTPHFDPPIYSLIARVNADFVTVEVKFEKVKIEGELATKEVFEESKQVALNPYVTVDNVVKYKNKETTYRIVDGEWDMQSNYDLPPQLFKNGA